jgi:hypothetical protein
MELKDCFIGPFSWRNEPSPDGLEGFTEWLLRRIIINNICINTLGFLILVLSSCGQTFNTPTEDKPTNEPKVEKILSEIDHGLYKVQINDSTTSNITEICTDFYHYI